MMIIERFIARSTAVVPAGGTASRPDEAGQHTAAVGR